MASGLAVAAPRSGSGKTLLTLGLLRALGERGIAVAPAKTGPDYIDRAILAAVAGREAVNLDPWAMSPERLRALASAHAAGADLLLVEGAMGLFDGAADGSGSTGDLAKTLGLPIVLVIDAERQSQSVAPLAAGFANWDPQVRIAGVILNRVAGARHEQMLRTALARTGLPVLGAVPRQPELHLPDRHLGLVLPAEIRDFEAVVAAAATAVANHVDLDLLLAFAPQLFEPAPFARRLPPLGQRIAIARDDAFAFTYPHWLVDWHDQGAALSLFSPLADEAPATDADAVFLPGGYPELHAPALAAAGSFFAGLRAAAARGALVYGECGGFMALGETLTDAAGGTHAMAGLLPVATRMDQPRRQLGYRRLRHRSPLPWPPELTGHEFHYSEAKPRGSAPPLFAARDALGTALAPMGMAIGKVLGSYAHVVDVA